VGFGFQEINKGPPLAEAKDLELQRSRDFEASIEDEERHRKTATTAPEDKLKNVPLTRERFEE
jgi:hypothetical protein